MNGLRIFLEANDLPSGPEVIARFEVYLELLQSWGRKMNLIGRLSVEEIIHELFCDSLSIAALRYPMRGPVLDIGTGAGFPSVPLKLLQPDLELWLVEPREKRIRFLGQVIRRLGLEGVERHRARVEAVELPPAGLLCSKAFAPVEQWLDVAAARVAPGGHVAVLCADAHWSSERVEQARDLGLRVIAERRHQWRPSSPMRRALLLEREVRRDEA